MSSTAQINANRANSQFSTGPTTDAGKAKSSHNAVKSALTGQTILLPTDDVPAYEKLAQALIDLHRPAAYQEEILVQSLIDTEWRLRRVPGLEAAIYALGRREFADSAIADRNIIDVQVFLKYERHLKNLSIQEARLRRMYEKDLARLSAMQAERKEAQQAAAKEAAKRAPEKTPVNPEIGFEFSNPPPETEQRSSASVTTKQAA
jgi:hypothetical protein